MARKTRAAAEASAYRRDILHTCQKLLTGERVVMDVCRASIIWGLHSASTPRLWERQRPLFRCQATIIRINYARLHLKFISRHGLRHDFDAKHGSSLSSHVIMDRSITWPEPSMTLFLRQCKSGCSLAFSLWKYCVGGVAYLSKMVRSSSSHTRNCTRIPRAETMNWQSPWF